MTFLSNSKSDKHYSSSKGSSKTVKSEAIDDKLTFNEDAKILIDTNTLLKNDVAGYTATTTSDDKSGCWVWSGSNCFWQPYKGHSGSSYHSTTDKISIVSVQDAVNGSVSLVNGKVSFVPAANYNGPAQFTYTISNGKGGTDKATVKLNICAVNDNPDAINDTITGTTGVPVVIAPTALLGNDKDVDGDKISITSVQGAVNGKVALVKGNIVFTPNSNFTGEAKFTYTISDGKGGKDTATVTVNVAPPANTAPDAKDDTISDTQTSQVVISLATLLGNDTDANGDALQGVSIQNPVNGTVEFNGVDVVFTPTTGYSGPASFTYTITDGKGGFDTATVNLTIAAAPVNIAPDAKDDTISGTQTGQVVIDPAILLGNDVDADGDAIQGVSLQNPLNGTVAFIDGKVVFTPTAGYSGPASFTYTITDGKGGFDTATVNLTIAAVLVNTPPVAVDDDVYVSATGPFTIKPDLAALANDFDVDGDTIIIINKDNVVGGSIEYTNDIGTFTPTPGYTGPASFEYTLSDGKGGTDIGKVNLNITASADITGTNNSEVLLGSAANNGLDGGAGNDVIIGGAGNDALLGGAGADTFVWTLADTSGTGIEIDTVYDIETADNLNLKDLLLGESNDASSLDNYLHFNFEGGNTVISVSTQGQFSDNNQTGSNVTGTVDQQIVLAGVDLTAGQSLSDAQAIQNLLSLKVLVTD